MSWLEPPNDGRYGAVKHWSFLDEARSFDDFESAPSESKVVDLRRDDLNWHRIEHLSALEEVTAIQPSAEQLEMLFSLKGLKRLRLWHIRKTDLAGLDNLGGLEESALFHVSGPKTAERIGSLPNLQSLVIEAMPSLKDFSGLAGAAPLRCLCISGGMSGKLQSIQDLCFLGEIKDLQHLMLTGVRLLSEPPNFRALRGLDGLESLAITSACVTMPDLAYLHAHFSSGQLLWPQTYEVLREHTESDANGLKSWWAEGVASTRDEVARLPDGEYRFCSMIKGVRSARGPLDKILQRVVRHEEEFAAEVDRQRALDQAKP